MTKLGKERELLDLFAIIHGIRPKLVTKLEEALGAYKTDGRQWSRVSLGW